MPIIIPANSAVAGGFSVDNSCRFDGSSSKLVKSQSAGNRQRWTYSVWLKRCAITSTTTTFFASSGGGNVYSYLGIQSDKIRWLDYDSGNNSNLITTAVFRDPSAWYHVVFAFNSNLGSGETDKEERTKLYINGVRVTSFGTAAYAGHNQDSGVNVNSANFILSSNQDQSSGSMWNGYMAEAHFIDGTAYQADSFGEFDSDSGVWKPIEVSGLTYGTNGYYLDFKDSANLGNDANGGTDFTESGLAAIDQTTDTCTNNFSTWNPLIYSPETLVFTEGNTNASNQPVGAQYHGSTTIGMTSGKWYAEFKCTAANQYGYVGISANPSETARSDRVPGYYPDEYTLYSYNGYLKTNNGGTSFAASFTSNNDIIGVAVDLDNNKLYFSKNGDWATGSGAWGNSTFNAGTGAKTITASNLTTEQAYFFIIGDADEGSSAKFNGNFGNPSYSTGTNQDSNDRGSFAYAVPSGFFSVCTSNISEALS